MFFPGASEYTNSSKKRKVIVSNSQSTARSVSSALPTTYRRRTASAVADRKPVDFSTEQQCLRHCDAVSPARRTTAETSNYFGARPRRVDHDSQHKTLHTTSA